MIRLIWLKRSTIRLNKPPARFLTSQSPFDSRLRPGRIANALQDQVRSKTDSIWTRAFAVLCFAQLSGYAQHAILTPTLPLYITHLGGSPFILGVVLAAFAGTSV